MVWWEWGKCMGVLPALVRLDLVIGGGLVGDGEEVFGAVSGCEMKNKKQFLLILFVHISIFIK